MLSARFSTYRTSEREALEQTTSLRRAKDAFAFFWQPRLKANNRKQLEQVVARNAHLASVQHETRFIHVLRTKARTTVRMTGTIIKAHRLPSDGTGR